MAVVTGSFSIREYAARGRAELGFHKCWPFSCEGEDAPSLPPISVRRFRWWADVVVAARSEALHEMEACPYNTSSAPESEIVAGNEMVEVKTPSPLAKPMDDEDSKAAPGSPSRVEGRRPSKGKLRNPKKRSIVELFATAPQVAVAVSEDETDDGNGGCRGKEGKEVDAVVVEHKGDIELSTKTKKETKQSKMRRKRRKRKKGIPEGHKVELRDWVKEKMCPKISSVYSSMLQHPLCRRRIKSAKSPVRSQRKSNSMKAIRIKHREMQTSKLMSRNQVVGKKLHIRRAYKNQEKHIAARRSRKIISARAAKLAKLYCKSNRHVTFSTKDDILEHSKTCSSMNYPRLKSLCHVISDAFVASSVMNHSSTIADGPDAIDRPQMVNSGENGSPAGVLDRIEAFSYESIQLNDSHAKANQPPTVNSSIRNCSGPEKASFAVMFDLNHAVETSGDLDDLSPTTNFSPSFICSDNHSCRGTIHSKDLNSAALIHLEASLPIASDTSLVPTRHDKFVSVSDSKSSPTLINNPSSASRLIASNLSNVRQYHTHVHAMMNNCHQIEENQSAHLCPSMGLLSSVCYSMGSKGLAESGLTQELGSLCKSKCSEDFIGLPLNSQGELIQLSSGTKFSEICRRQNTELCSLVMVYLLINKLSLIAE
ncbi:hypothetical protein HPP92_005186 [Vanilla planifolia]|uniref:Uncharacterized protein n=1 Tax=Vanilla planifolia TaxID=51239 RepID=A0A835RJT1_VANPL|nr:hypothetical protein HPP92_005186 [Vanilla planifolia]